MKLHINSEEKEFYGQNISELLNQLGIDDTGGMALAVNNVVIPRRDWAEFLLRENDKIIIIKATQGG